MPSSPTAAEQASATSRLPKDRLVVVGHSLGGWVTLNLAASGAVGCAVVVGTGTTALVTARSLLPAPLPAVLSLRATPDVALLDSVKLARRVAVPTLVVGSRADEMMPVSAAEAIHQNLGRQDGSALFIATHASHGGYFRDPQVVQALRSFMDERCGN